MHHHFLEAQEMSRGLLRFFNLVAITQYSYRWLPVSRNIEAPAFDLWSHSKYLGACGIQHLPLLGPALSQSRNYSPRRRDFACFANTHTLHNSCCLEQSARRWELFAGSPFKGFRPTFAAPSRGWQLLGCLMFQLGQHSALLVELSCWTASCAQILWLRGSKSEMDSGLTGNVPRGK